MNRVVFILLLIFVTLNSEKIRYISTEHPSVTYHNPKYMSFLNVSSHRYGRGDPFYYVAIHMYLISTIDRNVSVHFYFYEFLSNRYKRGFVEMHFNFCDLIEKDMFFGSALRQGKFTKPCPYPPGQYDFYNMTIPIKQIPHNFPFKKGRIYCNLTLTATDELMASGLIDMELKEARVNNKRT